MVIKRELHLFFFVFESEFLLDSSNTEKINGITIAIKALIFAQTLCKTSKVLFLVTVTTEMYMQFDSVSQSVIWV